MREKFSIPVDKITVKDDSGTEMDEALFADLSAVSEICFVIKDNHDNGKFKKVLHCINSSAQNRDFLSRFLTVHSGRI